MKKLKIIAFMLTMLVAASAVATPPMRPRKPAPVLIKAPAFLNQGDKIAIISPGSTPKTKVVSDAVKVVESWGYEPVVGNNAIANYHMYAGTTEQRTTDLLWALRDPSVKAILCSRGGYGSSLLLDEIPRDTFMRYPKWIIGYSDITALHSAEVCAGNMSIHGNMCGRLSDTGGNDQASQVLRNLLAGELPSYTVPGNKFNKPGKANGVLVGGNMAVFSNIAGSKNYDFLDRDFVEMRNIILFFEDVSENPSRVNSMLTQLKLKGILDHVKGIVIGRFTDYTKPYQGYDTMDDMLSEYLEKYDIPICYDFPVSHDEDWNFPVIEGCDVELEVTADEVKLNFLPTSVAFPNGATNQNVTVTKKK